MPTFEHAGLGLRLAVKDDLRQGDLEKWAAAIREFEPKGMNTSNREFYGAQLRGALKAEIAVAGIPGTDALRPLDVAAIDPRWVNWFGLKLAALYRGYDEIPPE